MGRAAHGCNNLHYSRRADTRFCCRSVKHRTYEICAKGRWQRRKLLLMTGFIAVNIFFFFAKLCTFLIQEESC